jgi:hypothetical protein
MKTYSYEMMTKHEQALPVPEFGLGIEADLR